MWYLLTYLKNGKLNGNTSSRQLDTTSATDSFIYFSKQCSVLIDTSTVESIQHEDDITII